MSSISSGTHAARRGGWGGPGRLGLFAVVLGVGLLGACAGVFALYLWFADGEIQENRYDTYVEARASLDRGWLRSALPLSATAIHESHDLDTDRCVGSFRFDPGERATMEAKLQPGLRPDVRIDRDPSFARRIGLDPGEDQLRAAGFRFYSEAAFAFAINWDEGTAYFWNSLPQSRREGR